jgi:hypothetical protein
MTTEIEKTNPPMASDADAALTEGAQRRRLMDHDHPSYKWIVLSFDPFHLGGCALWLIGWRVVQGVGGRC